MIAPSVTDNTYRVHRSRVTRFGAFQWRIAKWSEYAFSVSLPEKNTLRMLVGQGVRRDCVRIRAVPWTSQKSTEDSMERHLDEYKRRFPKFYALVRKAVGPDSAPRSEEHTSELQSRGHLVCR